MRKCETCTVITTARLREEVIQINLKFWERDQGQANAPELEFENVYVDRQANDVGAPFRAVEKLRATPLGYGYYKLASGLKNEQGEFLFETGDVVITERDPRRWYAPFIKDKIRTRNNQAEESQ